MGQLRVYRYRAIDFVTPKYRQHRYVVDILYCSAFWPTHIFYYRPQSEADRALIGSLKNNPVKVLWLLCHEKCRTS